MSDDSLSGDLYSYESLLDDDERTELAGIREFLQTEVKPRVAEHWAAATFPHDLVPRFAEAGLVGRTTTPRAAARLPAVHRLPARWSSPGSTRRWPPSSACTTAWPWARS